MSRPLVSIVIPSYNHARFLAQTIASVVAQTYRPLELVVVDDGSEDGSPALLEELLAGAALDRLELIEQTNHGAHAAIMRGIEASSGEIVGILNSDDAYHPCRVERLLPWLEREHELAFSGVRFVDGAGEPLPADGGWPEWYRKCLEETALCPTVGYALLVHNVSVSSGNFLFRRRLYDRLGGFSTHRFTHDWDFLIRTLHYAEPAFVREPLYDYRIHESNTTETVRHLLLDEARDTLGRFFELVTSETTPNPLAPCPANWPRYFPDFLARYEPGFAPGQTLDAFLALRPPG